MCVCVCVCVCTCACACVCVFVSVCASDNLFSASLRTLMSCMNMSREYKDGTFYFKKNLYHTYIRVKVNGRISFFFKIAASTLSSDDTEVIKVLIFQYFNILPLF